MGVQHSGHPAVREKSPGPNTKVITHNQHSKMGPNSGQVARSHQSGSTNPKTDGGGGIGNDCAALHRSICGK